MRIIDALKKLHEAYKNGNPRLGCVSRAHILYHIMRRQNLNPKLRQFSFSDDKGNKITPTHCIVVLGDMVYDSNIEESQNPIPLYQYEKINKYANQQLKIIWKEWNELSIDEELPDIWNYLRRFDLEFQQEIKTILMDKYYAYLDKYPHLKENESSSIE